MIETKPRINRGNRGQNTAISQFQFNTTDKKMGAK